MNAWYVIVQAALAVYANADNYAYFYGAKGEVLTDARMEELWNAYPNHFSKYDADMKRYIFNYSRGKIGYDCSGFVGALVGDASGSSQLIAHCPSVSTDYLSCAPANILWKEGHVGIAIGYGFCLHFPSEGHSCTLSNINSVGWTKSGYHKNVNYLGAQIGGYNR